VPSPQPLSPSPSAARPQATRAGRTQDGLLLAGVLIAFSPTLLDWAQHLVENPWARYAVVFPALFALAARQEEDVRPGAQGTGWIVLAALGVEVLAAFLGVIRLARPALALAVASVCRRGAMASWRAAALLFLAVPLPTRFMELATPAWTCALALPGVHLGSALGLDVELVDATLRSSSGAVVLSWTDAGLNLVPLLAGIGWYHGLRARSSLSRALGASAGLACLALPIQAAALTGAALATALGASQAAQAALPHLPWIATATIGIAAAEGLARRGEGAPR
jgi:hypothetical protein